MRNVEQAGKLKIQTPLALELRGDISGQGPLLQRGNACLQPDGMAQPKEIQSADTERDARAESSGSSGRIQ